MNDQTDVFGGYAGRVLGDTRIGGASVGRGAVNIEGAVVLGDEVDIERVVRVDVHAIFLPTDFRRRIALDETLQDDRFAADYDFRLALFTITAVNVRRN